MRDVTLRALKWDDYMVCYWLFEKTFDLGEKPNFVKSWKNRDSKASFVAVYHDIIIGFVLVDSDNCIQYLLVNEEFRNFSIGSKLLKRTCEALKDAPSIWLKTASDPRLRGWYERFGFVHEHTYYSRTNNYLGSCMIRRQRGRNKIPTGL